MDPFRAQLHPSQAFFASLAVALTVGSFFGGCSGHPEGLLSFLELSPASPRSPSHRLTSLGLQGPSSFRYVQGSKVARVAQPIS